MFIPVVFLTYQSQKDRHKTRKMFLLWWYWPATCRVCIAAGLILDMCTAPGSSLLRKTVHKYLDSLRPAPNSQHATPDTDMKMNKNVKCFSIFPLMIQTLALLLKLVDLHFVFVYFPPHLNISRSVIHHALLCCQFRTRMELHHIKLHLVYLCCMETRHVWY